MYMYIYIYMYMYRRNVQSFEKSDGSSWSNLSFSPPPLSPKRKGKGKRKKKGKEKKEKRQKGNRKEIRDLLC